MESLPAAKVRALAQAMPARYEIAVCAGAGLRFGEVAGLMVGRALHATISETTDTYGHLFPDHEEHGRGAIDSAFE